MRNGLVSPNYFRLTVTIPEDRTRCLSIAFRMVEERVRVQFSRAVGEARSAALYSWYMSGLRASPGSGTFCGVLDEPLYCRVPVQPVELRLGHRSRLQLMRRGTGVLGAN